MKLQRFFLFVVLNFDIHGTLVSGSICCLWTYSDLQFIKKLQSYHDIDSKTAGSAVKAILNHLWYLTEDIVGLVFLCDDVPDVRKLTMLSELQKPARKQSTVQRLEAKIIAGKIGNMELDDFLRRDPDNCLKSSQLLQHS